MQVERVDKGGCPQDREKIGRCRMGSILENATRDGVKGGGVGDLHKGISDEELEAIVDAIIRIQ